MVPAAFEPLMGPHLNAVDKSLEPGLTKLTWTSLNINHFVESVYTSLDDLELLMNRANDLVEFRIDAVLCEMSNASLCELPDEEPWSVDEFLDKTQVNNNN